MGLQAFASEAVKRYPCSSKTLVFDTLRAQVETVTAVEAAELFLSPHIRDSVFLEALREPGPSLWIVNRSDVSDRVLEKLLRHPQSTISSRAAEKIKMRQATITHLSAPIIEEHLDEIPDYAIEDLIGHPLCPWEAMIYFAAHPSEDIRASSCLSVTRRLWEHPKQSLDFSLVKERFFAAFYPVAKSDPSPMVRGYAARIPIWRDQDLRDFLSTETHARVLAKWLQNDGVSSGSVADVGAKVGLQPDEDPFLKEVIALDERLPMDLRRNLHQRSANAFERAIHEAYLQ